MQTSATPRGSVPLHHFVLQCFYGGIMGEVFNDRTQTARKAHICFWCGETIPHGTIYRLWNWKDGAEPLETIKCHAECADAWSNASRLDGYPYETGPGEHSRGCTCKAGDCRCSQTCPMPVNGVHRRRGIVTVVD